MVFEHAGGLVRITGANRSREQFGRRQYARQGYYVLLQLRPTDKAIFVSNDVQRIGEFRTGGRGGCGERSEAFFRSGVALLKIPQQLFGLVLEMFEVWVCG